MTNTTKPSHYVSPGGVSANYRLQAIKALIEGLEYEQTWSASSRKAVTLALLNHALANTEADLSDALGYDADNDEDPWDFASSDCASDSIGEEPQSAQVASTALNELCDLAANHLRLNPLSDKHKISELVVAELGEMRVQFVKGFDLIRAIDQAFAQRMIEVLKPIDIFICSDIRGLGLKSIQVKLSESSLPKNQS